MCDHRLAAVHGHNRVRCFSFGETLHITQSRDGQSIGEVNRSIQKQQRNRCGKFHVGNCSAVEYEGLKSKQGYGQVVFFEKVLTTVSEPSVKSGATYGYKQQYHTFDASRRLGMVETKTDNEFNPCTKGAGTMSYHDQGYCTIGRWSYSMDGSSRYLYKHHKEAAVPLG